MSHILQHIVQHILDASKLPTFTKSPQVTLCWKMLKDAEGGCLQNLFHCFIVSAFINPMNLMTFWFHPFHLWRFHPHSHGMSRRGPLGEVRSEVLSFSSFELGFSLERILHFLGLHFLGAVQRFYLFFPVLRHCFTEILVVSQPCVDQSNIDKQKPCQVGLVLRV